MQNSDLLWRFNSTESNSFGHLFDLFVEFVISNLTILSFISLTGIVSQQFEILSTAIVLLVSVLSFLILSEVFIVFVSRYKMSYSISDEGIFFNWGMLSKRKVFVPFEEIESINLVDQPKLKRKAVEFKTNITNGSLGIEIGALSYVLSFERLNDLAAVTRILESHYEGPIYKKSTEEKHNLFYRFSKSNLYHKLNLFLAFSFIYVAVFIGIKIFDYNLATQKIVKDVVVEENMISKYDTFIKYCYTSEGYQFKKYSNASVLGEEIEFTVSPIYDTVTQILATNYLSDNDILNGYKGNNLIMKVFCFIILILFAIYIIYKRGNLYRDDYILIIFGPILITLVGGFYIYH